MSTVRTPENTAGYEARIAEYTTEHGMPMNRFERRSLARLLHKRQIRMWDEDLERIFMHSDLVPPAAFQHVERGTCRHCEVAA